MLPFSLLFSLVLVLSSVRQSPAKEPPDEMDIEDKATLFNDDLIERIDAERNNSLRGQGRLDEIRHRLGTLGVYFRVFKELLPLEAGTGYRHIFPVQTELHSEVAANCSEGLEPCVDFISNYLRKAHPWLTGEDGAREETELSREQMEQIVNDNAASLEVSATQVLCWMTMREIDVFEHIPFCEYGLPSGTNQHTVKWPGKLYHRHPGYLDGLSGDPFTCARKSFCPDPCCLDVDPATVQFSRRECEANACKNAHKCYLKSKLNDDLRALRENRWNVSCPCGHGMFFRSDVAQCVHENMCAKKDLCGLEEECQNVIGGKGYKCVCQLGYVRGPRGCLKYATAGVEWYGPALAEVKSSSPLSAAWSLLLPVAFM